MEETALRTDRDSWDRGVGRPGIHASAPLLRWLTVSLVALTIGAFLIATPGGLLSKARMIGYAVCHQIPSHSFTLAGRQLPLCARCTGTFLGALVGLLSHALLLRRGRAAQFPPPAILAVLIAFTLAWAADGANSYLSLVGGPSLYAPRNSLRLTTGALNGLTISALLYPVLNLGLWRAPADQPTLRNLPDLGASLLLELSLVAVILTGWDRLLYPVALLSTAGVLTLLTGVNTIIALIVLGRENSVETWLQALWPIGIGLAVTLVQLGAISLIRYGLTGTLGPLPGL